MLAIWAHEQMAAEHDEPTPHERVTGGDFTTPADWTKINVDPVDGNFVVAAGVATFSSRREYRIEQGSNIPAGASCDISLDYDASDLGLEIKIYLNGTIHSVVTTLEPGPGHIGVTLVAGSLDNKIGIQARHVFSGRTCSFTNFSILA